MPLLASLFESYVVEIVYEFKLNKKTKIELYNTAVF